MTRRLVATIAGLLDAHSIPGVVWGSQAIIVHGVPSLVEVISTCCSMDTRSS